MTNKSEEYKVFIGGRQFRQVLNNVEESVPAFEIKTMQYSIENFVEIENTRIMVKANSFKGEIDICIEKHEWCEEYENWEDSNNSTYSMTEIQAILHLLENIANYCTLSPKTVK